MDNASERATTAADNSTDGDHTAAAPPPPQPDIDVGQLEDRWRRAVADLDNLRKRYARELDRERTAERNRVTALWLPVVDNLDLALTHADSDSGAVLDGVRAIRDQAVYLLEQLGFERHSETGVPFSPEIHEVVGVVDDPDQPPGTVLQVLRPGYGRDPRLLRPASVLVSRLEG